MKLHSIVRKSAEVMFQIAILYEMLEDYSQSLEWLMQCVSIAPTGKNLTVYKYKILIIYIYFFYPNF